MEQGAELVFGYEKNDVMGKDFSMLYRSQAERR